MPPITRRLFLKQSALPVAALCLNPQIPVAQARVDETPKAPPPGDPPGIIDTNVHLFDWPFRRLKYADTDRLVTKLRSHRIIQAWAGSYEALLHKDLDAVNARLTARCAEKGKGWLLPFGSVNPAWPDWEEDLRKCHEAYRMPGIRLYPSYHGYTLEHPEFPRLLGLAADRGLIVQIALEMEDKRVHHPIVQAPVTNAAPLAGLLQKVPHAKVQLLQAFSALRARKISASLLPTGSVVDIASIEGTGALGQLIDGDLSTVPLAWPAERLLFGSNAPFFPVENALLKLFESPLARTALAAIMQANAQHFLHQLA